MQEINNNFGTFMFLLFAGTIAFAAILVLIGSMIDLNQLKKKRAIPILFAIAFILGSCGYAIGDFRYGAVVVKVEQINAYRGSTNPYCLYYTNDIVNTGSGSTACFADKCGRFNIGDSVRLKR